MNLHLRRPSPALVVAILALVAALGGGAFAAIPADDGDVHFCYSKKTGNVQVVNTQTDTFDCVKGWGTFILDSFPTKLVSPNGDFRVQVTDTGITLGGHNQTIVMNDGGITISSATKVVVKGSTVSVGGSSCAQPTARQGDVVTQGPAGSQQPIVTGSPTVRTC